MHLASLPPAFMILAATLSAGGNAFACRGPDNVRTALLETLPANAFAAPIVARVEIVRVAGTLTTLKVIEPLKGVEAGQIMPARIRASTCDQDVRPDWVGRRYYIAGQLVPAPESAPTRTPHFRGYWRIGWRGEAEGPL